MASLHLPYLHTLQPTYLSVALSGLHVEQILQGLQTFEESA